MIQPKRMKMLSKRSVIIILVVCSALSIIKLYTLAPSTSGFGDPSSSSSPRDFPDSSHKIDRDLLSPKEYQLLSNLVSGRAPCNLLFFGVKQQFLAVAALNTGGITIFLEDDSERLKAKVPKGIGIYLVKGHARAGTAYELLEHARKHPSCTLQGGLLAGSECRLSLKGLPEAVQRRKWDVVVVDGPSGDQPEAPGRMGAIYTAAILAHRGVKTDVLVHDTDRMIEKWYSWEFLCHENLVSSKGKLWHFRITENSSSDSFCSQAAVQIL